MPRTRPPDRRGIVLTMVAALGLGGLACQEPPSQPVERVTPDTFRSWSLPADLADRAGTLARLELAGDVDRIDWLSRTAIEELVLRSTRVPDLSGLPPTLRLLDLCATPIERLGPLPAGLETLNLSYTGVTAVGELPDSLLRLSLGGVALPHQIALPDNLQALEIELSPHRQNPTELPTLPERLRTLALRASGITTLPEDLPTGLQALALEGTAIEVLPAVGERLEHLALRNNRELRRIDWPPRLRELHLDTLETRSLTTIPRYLRALVLWNIHGFEVGPLGDQLVTLELQNARGTRWTSLGQLHALKLVDTSPPESSPDSVEVLEVGEGVEIGLDRLATLSPVLRRLSVVLGDGIPVGDDPLDLSSLEGLEELRILSDAPLSIAALPSTLSALALRVPDLGTLPALPADLTVLDLAGSAGMKELPSDLPPALATLVLRDTDLSSLPSLPRTLRTLDVSGTSIQDLSEALAEVEDLRSLAIDLGQLETLEMVPATLTSLVFRSTEPERTCPPSTLEILGW